MQFLPGRRLSEATNEGGTPLPRLNNQARWWETRPRKCCVGGQGTARPQETLHLPAQWPGGWATHFHHPHRAHHHAADTAGPPGPGLSLWDRSPRVKALEPPAPR